MNSMQIKDKIRNITKTKNIDFNVVLRLYMYDRFIERLAVSKYRDNFILKGGFYLSILFSVENRSTMDIDTTFRNGDFNENVIKTIIEEIIALDINDNANLKLTKILLIRDEDEYGGFRVELIVELDNMREKFHIDIATGDPITPQAIMYNYTSILGDKNISLWAYNIETVLAEKIETILSRVEANSRIRDYYDIYLIYTRDWENINKNHFRKALEKTFLKREYSGDINRTIEIIKGSKVLRSNWYDYSKKNDYASGIKYEDIMECLEIIISTISVVYKS